MSLTDLQKHQEFMDAVTELVGKYHKEHGIDISELATLLLKMGGMGLATLFVAEIETQDSIKGTLKMVESVVVDGARTVLESEGAPARAVAALGRIREEHARLEVEFDEQIND